MAFQRLGFLLALSIIVNAAPVFAAGDTPDAAKVVDTFEKLGGVHKSMRRNHVKGVCVTGSFVGTAEARTLSSSAWFSGAEVPVVGRFSIAGPNPGVPDAAKAPHGLALEFRLPKNEIQHTTMINLPVFPAATVQSFYESLEVNLPDPATGKPDPARQKAYVDSHPEGNAARAWLASHNAATSYTNATYHSLHAFKFINGKNEHWVKWRFEARDGTTYLSDAETSAAPREFLNDGLAARLKKGPAEFDMIVIVGEKGDPIDNPSLTWPEGRKEIKAGVLKLTKGGADINDTCEKINFDPNVMSAGVDVSPDPILAFRSDAYGESVSRRRGE